MGAKETQSEKLLRSDVLTIVGLLTLASLVSYLGPISWLCDLVSQFRLQMAMVATFFALVLLVFSRGDHRLLLLSATASACVILNMMPLLAMHLTHKVQVVPAKKGESRFTVLQYNVLSSNPNREPFIVYVRQNRPDLLCIEEVNPEWLALLKTLSDLYPYQRYVSRTDNFGIALFSRLPLESSKELYLCSCGVPTIEGHVVSGDRKFTVVVTHPLPPVSNQCIRCRNEQLKKLGEMASSIPAGEGYILAGDLNAVSWTLPGSFWKNLREVSCRGMIVQTWPTNVVEPLRIPIDHVFYGGALRPTYQQVDNICNSDHMGLLTGFSFDDK